ncbi:MlaD family protein [Neolewinella persica]|uniref:MlaD family protein n=1 Tax=Neolewinella persica TaxID=70998 RepID=UPI000475C2DB|nr:MCE family protein [Neolewinella persica]
MTKALLLLTPILLLFCSCDRGTTIYVPTENAAGVQTGTPITISGLQVGTLVDVALDEQLTCWLTLNVEQEFHIGREAIFHLETTSLLGAKAITIENSLAGEMINSEDSLSTPLNIKSLIDSYSTTVDSTELKMLSRKAGEFLDSLMMVLKKEN